MGNYLSAIFVELPLSISDPHQRLTKIHELMENQKLSIMPFIVLFLAKFVGFLPPRLGQFVVDLFGDQTTLVLTNGKSQHQKNSFFFFNTFFK